MLHPNPRLARATILTLHPVLVCAAVACTSTANQSAQVDAGDDSTAGGGSSGGGSSGGASSGSHLEGGSDSTGSSSSGGGSNDASGSSGGGSNEASSSGSGSSSGGVVSADAAVEACAPDAGNCAGGGDAGVTPFYTDDFESATLGGQPAGWDNFIAYNYKTMNPQGDGTGALADDTHTHGGSKLAVHFKASGSNPVFLERPLPSGINHLYIRAYFYFSKQLGMQPSSGGDDHETLLGITADPTNVNTQVRFGQIKGVIGTNQVPSDNIAPVMAQWYSGPVISAGSWHCIQIEFAGDATYNSVHAYSDGTLVHSIAAATDWQNGALAANWMNGMFVDVLFGWQSFSGMANDVWMDDLAMSTGNVGCN